MFKWLLKKQLKNLINEEIEKIKEFDIKAKVLEYVKAHKEEVIEKAKESIKRLVKNLVAKVVEDIKNKTKK